MIVNLGKYISYVFLIEVNKRCPERYPELLKRGIIHMLLLEFQDSYFSGKGVIKKFFEVVSERKLPKLGNIYIFFSFSRYQ